MSKRKAAKASKQVTTKAQRASEAVVRGPKPRHSRSAAPASAELFPKLHSMPEAAVLERPATVSQGPTTPSQDNGQHTMKNSDVRTTLNVLSVMANVGAYQRKLPEISQAYMQLTFEFAQRLARIKSPFEIPSVLAELATRQLAILAIAL